MINEVVEENPSVKEVNIAPISKGKRMLAFLADFFITFIMTFVIFNVIVMPLANWIGGSTARKNRNNEAAYAQFDILYEQEIMFHESDSDKYYYIKNVETTLNCYLSFYSFNDTDKDDLHPIYGNQTKNEVLSHFYKDIRGNNAQYISIINKFNEEHPFFIVSETSISLVQDVKDNIRLSFFSPDDMSEDGKKALGYLQDFFLNAYADVFSDINKNDLVSNSKSYLENKAIVDQCEKELQSLLVVSSAIAYFLAIILNYIIIPLFNQYNKTLAMMMMRIVRIGTNNLYLLKKGELLLGGVYALAFALPIMFFMPMTQVAFTYLFNIVPLTSLLFVGVVLWIISFVVILISPLCQSLSDMLSRSVLIKDGDLDAIYRAKGYDI